MEQTPRQEVENKIVWKAWNDAEFAALLKSDPAAAVAQVTDMPIPAGVTVTVLEETADQLYIVLPSNRAGIDVEQLDQVASAADCSSWSSSCC